MVSSSCSKRFISYQDYQFQISEDYNHVIS